MNRLNATSLIALRVIQQRFLLAFLLAGLPVSPLAAQPADPGNKELAFRAVYKQLVEINTTL